MTTATKARRKAQTVEPELLAVRVETARFVREVMGRDDLLGPVVDVGPMQEESPVFGTYPETFVDVKALALARGLDYASLDAFWAADITADITRTDEVPREYAGTLLVLNVLEHVRRPWQAPPAIWKLLKPGGRVFVLTPWRLRFHGPAPDCWRFSDEGLRTLFHSFEIEAVEKRGGSALDPAAVVLAARRQCV